MNEEFQALLMNGTWTLVPLTPYEFYGLKWIFHFKQKADGSIELFKAHLVAKDFHQQVKIYFGETFSPVIKLVTIRVVLSLVVYL